MPVPTERNAKSSTPRATPRHCSPTAARSTSFSRLTGNLEAPTQLRAEGVALETRHAGRQADAAGGRVDDPWHSDDRAVDARRVEPGRGDERVAEPHDRVEHAACVLAEDLDVLAGADLAGEVADRAAEEPRADVETEHERRLGHGLEEDRAVARALRVVLCLAHEARLEQRLQGQRHGRLRDPGASRDLGPRDRCRGADRLEHGALVEVLEERGAGAARLVAVVHVGRNLNRNGRRDVP